MATTLKINGEQKSFDAPADMPLLWVLRDVLGMTGTKFGCGVALCGACTVHVDGKPVRSCMLPVGAVRDRAVTTIEGVPGSISRWCSAAIANRARSCRQPPCSRARPIRTMPTSTPRWRAISAAAAPMCAFAPRSSRRLPSVSRRRGSWALQKKSPTGFHAASC